MDQLIEYFKYILTIPLIGVVIVQAVNYWNADDLEKKLMTNYQKLLINVSLIIVGSLILTILTSLTMFLKKESMSFALVLVGFALSFILLMLSSLLTWGLTSVLASKPDFEIELGESKGTWKIIKVIHDKKLLVRRGEDESLIVSDYDNMTIKRIDYNDGWRSGFYKRTIKYKLFITGAILLSLTSLLLAYLLENVVVKVLFVFLFAVSLGGIFVAYMYSKWYQKEQDRKEQDKKID